MPKKILIVEDEEVLRRMYTARFEQDGIKVVTANNAEEGFPLIKKEMPDLVLLDIILPKKGGIDLLKEIREDPKTSKLQVLAFSNFDDPVTEEKAEKLGVLAYLQKTDYTPTEIVKKVKTYLKNFKT